MQYILRYITGLLLLSLSILAYGNMASPETEGSKVGTGHFSHDIDILSEVIDIRVMEELSRAEYTINYEVYSDKNREQVPLVFDVDNIEGSFQVSVHNQPVDSKAVKDIEGMRHVYKYSNDLSADSDGNSYSGNDNIQPLALGFDDTSYYFLIDLSEGTHNIRVSYTAIADENRSEWSKRYSYHYALAPAKLWKTFNNLTVRIHIEDDINTLNWTTNLGEPQSGKLNSENEWRFSSIPQDTIVIDLQKRPSFFAQILIWLNSWIVFILSMAIFGFIHLRLIKNKLTTSQAITQPSEAHIKAKTKFPRFIVWVGILVVPFLSLLITVLRFNFIDWLLGVHASRYHGYIAFILIFGYPIVLLFYLVFVRFIYIKWVQHKAGSKVQL